MYQRILQNLVRAKESNRPRRSSVVLSRFPCTVLRTGSMLVEAMLSAALLAIILIIISQTMVQLQAQHKLMEKQLLAQQTLNNLLEEYSAIDWEDLDDSTLASIELPQWVRKKLPQAEIMGEVILESEPVVAKRITLRLGWEDAINKKRKPVSLTTWVYHRPLENP